MSPATSEKKREAMRQWRLRHGGKKWRPGGPGRPPKSARQGGNVEPQCKPTNGPMRAEHSWDDDTDLCTACGAKRATSTPAAPPPRPQPRPIVAPTATRPGHGGRHSPTVEQRRAFGVTDAAPARPAVHETAPRVLPQAPAVHETRAAVREISPDAADEVARPVNWTQVIAELELEREELDVAIATLKRRHQTAVASQP